MKQEQFGGVGGGAPYAEPIELGAAVLSAQTVDLVTVISPQHPHAEPLSELRSLIERLRWQMPRDGDLVVAAKYLRRHLQALEVVDLEKAGQLRLFQ